MKLGEAEELARTLMAEHGLEEWGLVLDNAKTRAGLCRHRDRVISLSRPLTALHSREEVTDTVLHEIAHALVGPAHGHDAVWRSTARRIGCSGTRCVPVEAPRVEGAWRGVCPAGHLRTAHRRPVRVTSCGRCSPGRFDPEALFTWTHHGRSVPMHPDYEAELRRLLTGAEPRVPHPVALPVGARVRLLGSGRYSGLRGTIERRGRTRYKVRTSAGLLDAPFGLVAPDHEIRHAPGGPVDERQPDGRCGITAGSTSGSEA